MATIKQVDFDTVASNLDTLDNCALDNLVECIGPYAIEEAKFYEMSSGPGGRITYICQDGNSDLLKYDVVQECWIALNMV